MDKRVLFTILVFIVSNILLMLVFLPPVVFVHTPAVKMLVPDFTKNITLFSNDNVGLRDTQTISRTIHKALAVLTAAKEKFVFYFTLYFATVMYHITDDGMANVLDLVQTELYKENPIFAFVLSVSSIVLGHFAVYAVLFYFFELVSLKFKKLDDIRRFCAKFGWYMSALQLFDTFIPLLPIRVLFFIFSVVGVQVENFLFALLLSCLPDAYVKITYGLNLLNLDEFHFVADGMYLAVVLFAIGTCLFVCVIFSVYLFKTEEATKPQIYSQDKTEHKEKAKSE
ncbi:hypothetical protein EIN_176650 [Entamoeba invadens IP1]|uniref:hypothetical protein n=1 Tax=Entamoeba invadens IP1 TaxID=370355 RepID=UPI0002C3F02E|nr:hypothetical protein EIN_176650 [Entamoeba invadens IP1]ELP93838.1 hypothetical protein EIN_176650 [Entamoeba invadens IP1]|eukprot:XP_004260609.1 hypothetical protein EIN_176650 [Entamoeba invadens IP1]